MSAKRLILKSRHWRYTISSALLTAPVFITVVATAVSWLFNYGLAEEFLVFLLARKAFVLVGLWLAAPLVGWYLAHIAYQRGTIDRWRPINKTIKFTAVISLVAILGLAVLGRFI
jgi:multisubunit Na+/H+ antiporter MnhG subunit